MYDEIEGVENSIEEIKNRLLNIQQQKISEENVYQFLLYFDKLYDKFTDLEKKEFLNSFVEKVDIYEQEQPDVDHFKCAKHLTMAGVDIYHPTQDHLTGAEIAFGGDLIRCLKNDNYLVLETEAQGYPGWTPYDGQLRLQAYSHLASGALGVMYWHWHSIHNSFETYWRGLLSHDMEEICRSHTSFL